MRLELDWDTLLEVDGVPLSHLLLGEVQRLVLGPVNSPLTLTVSRKVLQDVSTQDGGGGGEEGRGGVDSNTNIQTSTTQEIVRIKVLRSQGKQAVRQSKRSALITTMHSADLLITTMDSDRGSRFFFGLQVIGMSTAWLGTTPTGTPPPPSKHIPRTSSVVQGRLELPTPSLIADAFSAFERKPQSSQMLGARVQITAAKNPSDTAIEQSQASGISFFGFPLRGLNTNLVAEQKSKDTQVGGDQASLDMRLKTREISLIDAIAVARESGVRAEVEIAEKNLSQVSENLSNQVAKTTWTGLGIKISACDPFVIESHWSKLCEGGTCDGDVVTAVDSVALRNLKLQEVHTLIKGPLGSTLALSILRSDEFGQLKEMHLIMTRHESAPHVLQRRADMQVQLVLQTQR